MGTGEVRIDGALVESVRAASRCSDRMVTPALGLATDRMVVGLPVDREATVSSHRFTFRMRENDPETIEVLLDGKSVEATHVRVEIGLNVMPVVHLSLLAPTIDIDIDDSKASVRTKPEMLADLEAIERTMQILGDAGRAELLDGMLAAVAKRLPDAEAADLERELRRRGRLPGSTP
jgi:hypothetical protein